MSECDREASLIGGSGSLGVAPPKETFITLLLSLSFNIKNSQFYSIGVPHDPQNKHVFGFSATPNCFSL